MIATTGAHPISILKQLGGAIVPSTLERAPEIVIATVRAEPIAPSDRALNPLEPAAANFGAQVLTVWNERSTFATSPSSLRGSFFTCCHFHAGATGRPLHIRTQRCALHAGMPGLRRRPPGCVLIVGIPGLRRRPPGRVLLAGIPGALRKPPRCVRHARTPGLRGRPQG